MNITRKDVDVRACAVIFLPFKVCILKTMAMFSCLLGGAELEHMGISLPLSEIMQPMLDMHLKLKLPIRRCMVLKENLLFMH